jgi:L-seryl-tRNA(Ser) seleniumtransferase
MLAMTKAELAERAEMFLSQVARETTDPDLIVSVVDGESAVGGGSGPNTHPPTVLIALKHSSLSADQLELRLRTSSPPVIARVAEGKVLLDLRTVDSSEESEVLDAIARLTS